MVSCVGGRAKVIGLLCCIVLAGAAPAWGQSDRGNASSFDGLLVVKRESARTIVIEEGTIPRTSARYSSTFAPEFLALSADKSVVVLVSARTSSADRSVRDQVRKVEIVRRVPRRQRIASFEIRDSGVESIAVAADGSSLAVGTESAVVLLETKTGKELGRTAVTNEVTALRFSPDGKALAVGDVKGGVRLCDVKTGKELWQTQPHRGRVGALIFSPDGKRIASGSDDGSISMLKADAGHGVQQMPAHRKSVAAIAFSHDGNCLASVGYDHRLITWDLSKGQQCSNLAVQMGLDPTLAFTLERSLILTFGKSRRVFDSSGKLIHQQDPNEEE